MSSAKYLLNAFEQRNIGKFTEALEVFQMNPNDVDEVTNRTVFEIILSEPGSTDFIRVCLQNDADFYMVSQRRFSPSCTNTLTSSVHYPTAKQQQRISTSLCDRV